jgi:hypothetical protein
VFGCGGGRAVGFDDQQEGRAREHPREYQGSGSSAGPLRREIIGRQVIRLKVIRLKIWGLKNICLKSWGFEIRV